MYILREMTNKDEAHPCVIRYFNNYTIGKESEFMGFAEENVWSMSDYWKEWLMIPTKTIARIMKRKIERITPILKLEVVEVTQFLMVQSQRWKTDKSPTTKHTAHQWDHDIFRQDMTEISKI